MHEENHINKKGDTFLIVVSVMAAATGVMLSIAFSVKHLINRELICILLAIAFALFVYVAEKVTDAIDYKDKRLFVYLYVPYNIAVILLLLSVFLILFFKFHFDWWSWPFLIFLWPWVSDTCFILCSSQLERYIIEPKRVRPQFIWWVKIIECIRNTSRCIRNIMRKIKEICTKEEEEEELI